MTTSGNYKQGEGGASRRDSSSAAGGPDWVQTTMFPPPSTVTTVRVAWEERTRTAMYQIEVSDPVTKELLALRSHPYARTETPKQALEAALRWLETAWQQLGVGDPF